MEKESINQDVYHHIKTKENYIPLLKSGMFWEFFPELSGGWKGKQ